MTDNMKKPTEDEINDVLNKCSEQVDEGRSKYPGMSYEQGIAAAINWMQGYNSSPLEDLRTDMTTTVQTLRYALKLSRFYVEDAARRMYDGTNNPSLLATQLLAKIDAALAAPHPAEESQILKRTNDLHEKAGMPWEEAEALARRESAQPTPDDIWPIAKLTIKGASISARLYAPGLPDGEHDVYPVPLVAPAHPPRVTTEAVRNLAASAEDLAAVGERIKEIDAKYGLEAQTALSNKQIEQIALSTRHEGLATDDIKWLTQFARAIEAALLKLAAQAAEPVGYASRIAIRHMQLGIQSTATLVSKTEAADDDVPVYLHAPASAPWSQLYTAVNAMMAQLGADGSISAMGDLAQAVMDALHDIDGGTFNAAFAAEPGADKLEAVSIARWWLEEFAHGPQHPGIIQGVRDKDWAQWAQGSQSEVIAFLAGKPSALDAVP